jgi:hypothetical protein
MAGRVYIETMIPSAYVSTRTDPTSVHRRELTRAWWADQAPRYDVSISEAIVLELAQGDWPGKALALEIVEPLQRVAGARNAVVGGRGMSNQHGRPVFVDVLIDEVRQRRRDLLASCGDDLDALVRLIRQREAEHPERIIDPRATASPKPPAQT